MGKRELIIIGAFAVVAVIAYQLTAPPPKDGEKSFSLSRIFGNIKREMSANSASANVTKTGTLTLREGVTEIRLSALRVVPLTVVGERRDDIAYEFWVESTGPDVATATDYAGRAKLIEDDLGPAQVIKMWFPEEGQQTGKLMLRVPERLTIRVENSGKVSVSGVKGVDLRNLAGETTISKVTGQVTGSHRSGELSVSEVGAVELSLSSSQAKLADINGVTMLKARNGDCAVTKANGPVHAEMTNVELTITDSSGTVRVSGESGSLRLVSPAKEFNVDVRRMLVEVTLAAAVAGTVITTDEPLRLTFGARPNGAPNVSIDAAVTEKGSIQAGDFGLTAKEKDGESRLKAVIGEAGPHVVLRNLRADIVISLRK